jgi:UDP-glucose 4-epimerase
LRSYGLRFFNVYGPRQEPTNPYSGVISIFANRILKGEPITINGGYQTRDFIYVNDIVRGIWNSYEYLLGHSVSTYSNLLTGNSISIDELANILISLAGNKVEKRYHKLPPGDPEKSLGTIDRMCDQLKMREFVELEDGLRQVLTWMRTA